MPTLLIVLGTLIVLVLAAYAASLLWKLKKQTQAREAAIAERKAAADKRREEIFTDIRYIALAMLEDRCEISEGVVRIAKLFEVLSLSERVSGDYPALFRHFERIRHHPIMEQRKALPKPERMKLDFERMKSEAELTEDILEDAKRLKDFKLANSH
ncbi:DUF2489 domain-containing protein [Shewanella amazonensis]|uniref:DUF2489 domain-containing protein n=1 Tax=Shewanella amazonensis (strain ATCC BAA-1098 / SB2B) TaxID=326297 RepID=A1S1P4_SHEAM|nr:DUF2489 domain-containing protein [Shewanella amazonensis]ABL98300.1 conserved hypothetical protein [Shewanella amazonensis SB2B]